MRRPKKTKPTAVAAERVTDSIRMEEPGPPAPPEPAPAPPPAPVPAAVIAPAHAAVQQEPPPKKRGRPTDTWFQIEEKKLKKLEGAYLSAERDRLAKIDEHYKYLDRMYPHDWSSTKQPPEPPPSLQKRFQDKMAKRQRKVDKLESAWQEAAENFEFEKRFRLSQDYMGAMDAAFRLYTEYKLLLRAFEELEERRKRAEQGRAAAEKRKVPALCRRTAVCATSSQMKRRRRRRSWSTTWSTASSTSAVRTRRVNVCRGLSGRCGMGRGSGACADDRAQQGAGSQGGDAAAAAARTLPSHAQAAGGRG